MKIIEGGVCAAKGFKAGSVRCGIKASRTNDDTAIIFSECECNAAATYTMNRVKAAPVYVTMEHLENGVARAIVANSGNVKFPPTVMMPALLFFLFFFFMMLAFYAFPSFPLRLYTGVFLLGYFAAGRMRHD